MLNQNDRRRLEEIERCMRDEDPEFVRRLTRWPPGAGRASWRWLAVLVLVIGILGMVISLLAVLPAVLILSLATAVAGGIWLRRTV
jgi:hypothetical protein